MALHAYFFIIFILIFVLKKVSKNYVLYQKLSSMEGFVPNPSYILGHLLQRFIIFYRLNKIGLEGFKTWSKIGLTYPFKDCGYISGWNGNLIFGYPFVYVSKVELIRAVLSSKAHLQKGVIYAIIKPVLGSGLISSDRETWTKRRKLLNPTFHQLMLQSYVPAMNKQSIKLVEEIKSILQTRNEMNGNSSRIVSNVTSIISHRVMAVLLQTVIGCNEGDIDPRFMDIAEKGDGLMCDRLRKPWKLLLPTIYDWTSDGQEFRHAVTFTRNEVRKLVAKRLSRLNDADINNNTINTDISNNDNQTFDTFDTFDDEKLKPALIDTLMNSHRKDPKETSLNDVLDEVLTFLATGWDTTTWTSTFTLLMLGLHPEIQDKVYEEISLNVENVENIKMVETMKMKYLECVINESLRLVPLVNIHARQAGADIEVDVDGKTVTIPKGVDIIFDSELVHMNENYWKDAQKFVPERFLPENSIGRDPFSFIPFSAGPRNCIGKAFGMMEVKIIIIHILSEFVIKSVDPLDKIKMNCQGIGRRTYEPVQFEFHDRIK